MLRRIVIVILMVMTMTSVGCTYFMPPGKVPSDRHDYVTALSKSWKEQLLYNLVMLKYNEPNNFLDIASIVTSYNLDASAQANYTYGWGSATYASS